MNRGYSAADAVAVDAYSPQLQYTMVIYWLLNLIIFDKKVGTAYAHFYIQDGDHGEEPDITS